MRATRVGARTPPKSPSRAPGEATITSTPSARDVFARVPARALARDHVPDASRVRSTPERRAGVRRVVRANDRRTTPSAPPNPTPPRAARARATARRSIFISWSGVLSASRDVVTRRVVFDIASWSHEEPVYECEGILCVHESHARHRRSRSHVLKREHDHHAQRRAYVGRF